jgi:hypothetical protein
MCPFYEKDTKDYLQFLNKLDGSTIGGAPVVVERVVNEGISYGQYSKMFDKYGNFDHYILTEDDYLPIADDFDTTLVQMFNDFHKRRNCGFLCGLTKENVHLRDKDQASTFRANAPWHLRPKQYPAKNYGAISWGITNRRVLNDIKAIFGHLPFGPRPKRGGKNQRGFSKGFALAGYTHQDVTETHCTLYWDELGHFEHFGLKSNPMIFAPLQHFGLPKVKLL